MSYLARFLDISGFMGEPTDKTDKTPPHEPLTLPESRREGVSSVLSVPSPIDTKKRAPAAAPPSWPELAALRWGPALNDPPPDIIIDRPNPADPRRAGGHRH